MDYEVIFKSLLPFILVDRYAISMEINSQKLCYGCHVDSKGAHVYQQGKGI